MQTNTGFAPSGYGLFAAGMVGMFLILWGFGPRATSPETSPSLSSQPAPAVSVAPPALTASSAVAPPGPAATAQAVPTEPRKENVFANAVGKPWAAPRERITSLYYCLLERKPDEEGLNTNTHHWGNRPNAAGVKTFFQFDEYKQKRKSNREYVRDLYQALLGREPQVAEIQNGVSYLNANHGDRMLMLNVFIATQRR